MYTAIMVLCGPMAESKKEVVRNRFHPKCEDNKQLNSLKVFSEV